MYNSAMSVHVNVAIYFFLLEESIGVVKFVDFDQFQHNPVKLKRTMPPYLKEFSKCPQQDFTFSTEDRIFFF